MTVAEKRHGERLSLISPKSVSDMLFTKKRDDYYLKSLGSPVWVVGLTKISNDTTFIHARMFDNYSKSVEFISCTEERIDE